MNLAKKASLLILAFALAPFGMAQTPVIGLQQPGTVIKCVPTPIAHTGDTGNDIVEACKIPAGTLQAGSVFDVYESFLTASANTGTLTGYLMLGASAAGPGAPLIWTSAVAANRAVAQRGYCTVNSASALSCAGLNSLGYNAVTQAQGTISLTTTSDVYVLVYMQNTVAADTSYLQQLFVRITQ